jgi:hypothetical protein
MRSYESISRELAGVIAGSRVEMGYQTEIYLALRRILWQCSKALNDDSGKSTALKARKRWSEDTILAS